MAISNLAAEHDAELEPPSEEERPESDVRPTRESAESGVRAAPAFGARVEAALAASARTEATLADLFRTVKFLSAAIGTVRDANSRLARELESLAEILGGGARDTESERARLVSEHDKFIAMLFADHERDLEALRHRLAELEAAPEKA
jgi:hypothetical protein